MERTPVSLEERMRTLVEALRIEHGPLCEWCKSRALSAYGF